MRKPTARTYASYPSIFIGDAGRPIVTIDPRSEHSVDIYIRTGVDDRPLGSLHLTPAKARELRDALTSVLVELESAAIVAAGLEVSA